MDSHHSHDESIDPKDDYASLIATFLCQARNQEEVQLILNLINIDIRELSPRIILSVRERIECEPRMSSDCKSIAINMLDGQFALREIADAA